MSEAAAKDLQSFRAAIPQPATTLVVARHGLEWWAGYFLHTPVRMEQIPEDAASRYTRVLVLRDHRAGGRMADGPPRVRDQSPDDDDFDGGPPPWDRGGPGDPPDVASGVRPNGEPRDRSMRPMGPMRPMMNARLPEGAKLIATTDNYELYEVPHDALLTRTTRPQPAGTPGDPHPTP